jgi:hypothetical protein
MSEKPRKRYCTAKNAQGNPCKNSPLPGTTRCHHHSFKVPGRPTKLTTELRDQIVYLMVEGNYLATAAQTVGISERTLHRWLARGDDVEAKALEHVDDDAPELPDLYQFIDPADWVYLDFRHAVKSAEAYAETEHLRRVGYAAPGWQAGMTILERRHPARWRRRDSHSIEHSGELVARAEVVAPDAAEERRAIASILKESGALEPPDPENTTEEDPQ